MSNNCCTCGQPVLLSCYPFTRGAMYQCDCCTAMHQPNTAQYPAGGPMQETAYMLDNAMPFIVDNSTTNYGPKLSVSENVRTDICKRKDPACINVSARFDMTGDIITNTAYAAFLEQTISNHYNELNGVLPIMKSTVTFKIYFHIEDANGGVVYENSVTSIVKDHLFHYTDVKDFFITSFKNVAITNIPQLDFQGVYNIVFDRVEAWAQRIDTNAHVDQGLNPYYQFTNNNTKVVIQHDTIESTPADVNGIIGILELNTGFPVQLGLTTRLKISFTAFMSNTIAIGNSYGVYNALMGTTERSIEELCQRMDQLETEMQSLQEQMTAVAASATPYGYELNLKTNQLVSYTDEDVTGLYFVTEDYTTPAAGTYVELIEADVAAGKLSPITTVTNQQEEQHLI